LIIHTIGHSTRSLEGFVELLEHHHISTLVDIRTVPGSRRLPHFARANLEQALPAQGIAYVHLPGLGGLRRGTADSGNTAWRNASFRAYADYMQEPRFWSELEGLIELAKTAPAAVMCAEAVPWRCHRSLVADALLVRGIEVLHITGAGRSSQHRLTPFAAVEGGRISYPEPTQQESLRLDKLPTHG
jgi:uncharacterized protein (DUF488 family)